MGCCRNRTDLRKSRSPWTWRHVSQWTWSRRRLERRRIPRRAPLSGIGPAGSPRILLFFRSFRGLIKTLQTPKCLGFIGFRACFGFRVWESEALGEVILLQTQLKMHGTPVRPTLMQELLWPTLESTLRFLAMYVRFGITRIKHKRQTTQASKCNEQVTKHIDMYMFFMCTYICIY